MKPDATSYRRGAVPVKARQHLLSPCTVFAVFLIFSPLPLPVFAHAHDTTEAPPVFRAPNSKVADPVREFAPAPDAFLESLRKGERELRITAFGEDYILDVKPKSPFVAGLPLMRGIFAAGTVRGFPGSHVRLTAVNEHVHGLVDFAEPADTEVHRTFEIHPPNIHAGGRGGGRVERERRQRREGAYLSGETVVEMSRKATPTKDIFEDAHPRTKTNVKRKSRSRNRSTASKEKSTFDVSEAGRLKSDWSNATTRDGIPLRNRRAAPMTSSGTPLCGYKHADHPAKTSVVHVLPDRSPPGPPPAMPEYRVGGGKACTVFLDVDASVETALGSNSAASTLAMHVFAIAQDAFARSTSLGLEIVLKGIAVHSTSPTWDGTASQPSPATDIGGALNNYMTYLEGTAFTGTRQDICTNHALIWKAGKPVCDSSNNQCTCSTYAGTWGETVGIANMGGPSYEAVSTGSNTIKVGTVCASTENTLWPDSTAYGYSTWQAYFASDSSNSHYAIGAGVTAVGHWDISNSNCNVAGTAYSGADSLYVSRSTVQIAETLMHELGHQFGAQHDCGSTDPNGPTCGGNSAKLSQHMTDCANSNLDHTVMSYSNGIMNSLKFSDCSVEDMEAYFGVWDSQYQQPMSCLLSVSDGAAADQAPALSSFANVLQSGSAPAGISGTVAIGFDGESYFYFYYSTVDMAACAHAVCGSNPIWKDTMHNLYLWYDAVNLGWVVGYTVGSAGIYTGLDVDGYSNVCVNNRIWAPDGSFTGQYPLKASCLTGYCNSATAADCGSTFTVDSSNSDTACSTFPCVAAPSGADHANCCKSAVASCGDKNGVGGSGAVAITNEDCGTGYSYALSSSGTSCATNPCYVTVINYYDHPTCCVAHQSCSAANYQQSSCGTGQTVETPLSTTPCAAATCASSDCCGALCSTVSDAACGAGYIYDIASANQVCSASTCATASSSDTDHDLCCNVAPVTCSDKTGTGGSSQVAVTDAECGTGYSYSSLAAEQTCSTSPCATTVIGANDHPTCCYAHATCSQGYGSCSTPGTAPTNPLPGTLCSAPVCTDAECCSQTCASVTDSNCGAGFVADSSAAATACASQTCVTNTANSGDHTTCCTAAQATCGDSTAAGGGSGTAITDANCGSGYSYNANNVASACASASSCDVSVQGNTDHTTCCVAHDTCDGTVGSAYTGCSVTGLQNRSPVPSTACAAVTCTDAECCDQTCGSVSSTDCEDGYVADTSAVNTKCTAAVCDVSTANAGDHSTCCNAAVATCSDKAGIGGGDGTAVTDNECGSGYSYNPSNAASACQSNPCGTGIIGSYDHPTCCIIHNTCANPQFQQSSCGDYYTVKASLPTTACSASTCTAIECCDPNQSCLSSNYDGSNCPTDWAGRSPMPNTPCASYTGCVSSECCVDLRVTSGTGNAAKKAKDPTATKGTKDPTQTKGTKDPTKTKGTK
eukprot:gene12787-20594_t